MIAWRSLLLVLPLALAAPVVAGEPGAPYVPTPDDVVERMLKLGDVGQGDHLIDLGSGDGRIVLAAAERGASGLGVEIRQDLVDRARQAAEARGLSDRVRFVSEDLFTTDLSGATVVTLYLVPDMLERLRAKLLLELEPGTRVLSHDYPIPNWRSERVVRFDHPAKLEVTGVTRTVLYLYRVPAEVHGHWVAEVLGADAEVGAEAEAEAAAEAEAEAEASEPLPGEPLRLEFAQRVTDVLGRMHLDEGTVPLEDVTLVGRTLQFKLPERNLHFVGQVNGGTIEGTLTGEGVIGRWRARRS